MGKIPEEWLKVLEQSNENMAREERMMKKELDNLRISAVIREIVEWVQVIYQFFK